MIEITAVGGYTEVGRNMTAIKYRDEVIIRIMTTITGYLFFILPPKNQSGWILNIIPGNHAI